MQYLWAVCKRRNMLDGNLDRRANSTIMLRILRRKGLLNLSKTGLLFRNDIFMSVSRNAQIVIQMSINGSNPWLKWAIRNEQRDDL